MNEIYAVTKTSETVAICYWNGILSATQHISVASTVVIVLKPKNRSVVWQIKTF